MRVRRAEKGPRTCRWLGFAALAALLGAVTPAVRAADPAVSARIRVEVAADLASLAGSVDLTVANRSGGTLGHVDLWLFPRRLGRPPEAMDELSERWTYPDGFSAGDVELGPISAPDGRQLRLEARDLTTVRVHLPAPIAPGERVTLRIPFETVVPHRFGPFGWSNGTLTLDGGFFPRPPPLGSSGFEADAPPDTLDYELQVTLAGGGRAMVVTNGSPIAIGPGEREVARFRSRATRVSLVLLTRYEISALEVPGAEVLFVHRRPRHRPPGPGGLRDIGFVDIHGQSLATAASALRFLARVAGPAAGGGAAPLVMVESSLRRDIAIAAPSMVLVSDRAFELTGLERFRKFHRFALVRAVLGSRVAGRFPGRWDFHLADRVADLIAVDLAERWERRRYGGMEDATDVLRPGAFIAAVDEVIYAPQMPFQHIYFRTIEDTDAYRDRFSLFSHDHPNGRRLHEKLRDLAAADGVAGAVSAAVDELLRGPERSLEEVLAAHVPGVDARWLAMWGGPYPRVAYRLAGVEATGGGDDAEERSVRVEVERMGDTSVAEPVTVRVLDGPGGAVDGTWFAAGPRGAVSLPADDDEPRVQVDPEQRLVESDLGGNEDPRFDNRNYDDWKFLIDGIYFSFDAVAAQLTGGLVSLLQRRNDLTHLLILEAYEQGRSTGLAATWVYRFGPKVRPNLRRHHLATHLAVARLKPTDGDGAGVGAQASVSIGTGPYVSRSWPTEGLPMSLLVGATYSNTAATANLGGMALAQVAAVHEPWSGQVLGARLQLATIFGEISDQHRWSIGGEGRIRALPQYASTGRHRVLASLEWRHRFTRDLSVNVLQLGWLVGIEGVLFTDVGLLAERPGELFEREAVWTGVGYGLRFHYLALGVTPMLLAVDASVPLYPGLVADGSGVPPVAVLVGMSQAF